MRLCVCVCICVRAALGSSSTALFPLALNCIAVVVVVAVIIFHLRLLRTIVIYRGCSLVRATTTNPKYSPCPPDRRTSNPLPPPPPRKQRNNELTNKRIHTRTFGKYSHRRRTFSFPPQSLSPVVVFVVAAVAVCVLLSVCVIYREKSTYLLSIQLPERASQPY